MYEDRFGTEEEPIIVPSLESERIIGVTDPEDDNLVVSSMPGLQLAGQCCARHVHGAWGTCTQHVMESACMQACCSKLLDVTRRRLRSCS